MTGQDTLNPVVELESVVEQPRTEGALEILSKGSRSFSFAGWFLPADCRQDAAVLYAFCRFVDDVADEALDADTAHTELARVMAELYGEAPARPFLADVLEMFERRGVRVEHATELVRGVRSDLGCVRIPDDRGLLRYSYRVAGTVGLMMCGVLGVRSEEALPFAIDLGIAMQITNICRDVAEDARNGRVYLPATRLRALGIEPTPEGVLASPDGISRVVYDLLQTADRYYDSGSAGMHFIPARTRLAIGVASRVYRAIGVRLRNHDCDALAGRTVVPFSAKLWHGSLGLITAMAQLSTRVRHRSGLHRALDGLPGAHKNEE